MGPRRAGVIERRDELLEAAIRNVLGPEADEQEIRVRPTAVPAWSAPTMEPPAASLARHPVDR